MNDNPTHRLIKLLETTASTNDHEALVAIRKANALIKRQGWDWTRLFAERETVFLAPLQHRRRSSVPTFHMVFG